MMHQLNGQRRACRLQVTDGQDNYRNTIKRKKNKSTNK